MRTQTYNSKSTPEWKVIFLLDLFSYSTEPTEISQQQLKEYSCQQNLQEFSFSPLNVLKNMSDASKLWADSKSTPVSNLQ